jgi:tetratricopeptide (TPR) repeat protein
VYGEAALKCKQYEMAIEALERSLHLNPGNPSATYWLNMAKMFKKD